MQQKSRRRSFAFNFKYEVQVNTKYFTYIAASAMVFIVEPEQFVVDVFETEFRVPCFKFERDISTTDLEQPLPICGVLYSLKNIHNSTEFVDKRTTAFHLVALSHRFRTKMLPLDDHQALKFQRLSKCSNNMGQSNKSPPSVQPNHQLLLCSLNQISTTDYLCIYYFKERKGTNNLISMFALKPVLTIQL